MPWHEYNIVSRPQRSRESRRILFLSFIADAVVIAALLLLTVYIVPPGDQYVFGQAGIVAVAIIPAVAFYYTQKAGSGSRTAHEPDFLSRYNPRNCAIDGESSEKYTESLGNLIRSSIRIYRFDSHGSRRPAFMHREDGVAGVYIDRRLFTSLTSEEMRALVLHEIGHYTERDETSVLKNYGLVFLILLLMSPLSAVVILTNGLPGIFYAISVAFAGSSMVVIILLKSHLFRNQDRADSFAVLHSGNDTAPMASLMDKLEQFARDYGDSAREAGNVEREMEKRKRKLVAR